MSCGCNNNSYGGCGCQGTVQYAPPACNPNFPTTCTSLGAGTIVRVVGEDSSSCKYTVPTLTSNSILFYNASTGLVKWGDGSSANPIFLGDGTSQVSSATVGGLQGTTPTGQLVEFNPSTSAKAQFPVVTPSGTTTNWGTVDSIIPNQGIVYKTGNAIDGSLAANTVYQLAGLPNQFLTFNSLGNPVVSFTNKYTLKTTTYSAAAGDLIAADTTGGAWTLTLPSNPATGDIVTVIDAGSFWAIFNLTVAPAGSSTIQGQVQNFICDRSHWSITFYFNQTTWKVLLT
jgi:hypothetical protein